MSAPVWRACLLGWAFLLGCGAPPDASPEPLRVLAAASLTDVVAGIVAGYGGAVETSFGASSALARQIRDGAPADVFVSASPRWIDYLRDARAVRGEPVLFARNRLVAVATAGSGLAASDPQALLDALAPDDRLAIADEGVPAGEYARAALERLGLLEAFRPRLVGQSHVRAALLAVERGQLPAGFVYATDAAVAGVDVLFTLGGPEQAAVEYQAVALAGAANKRAARAFLDYLAGDEVRRRLTQAGFVLP